MIGLARLATVSIVPIACPALSAVWAAETAAPDDGNAFPPEQIEQLVAPIALYRRALIVRIMSIGRNAAWSIL